MNGVALLVAMATIGVDYSSRTTEDGLLEYTIQIEPEFLQALAEGEEIHSDVPPEVGDVQRICVRIGTTPVRHTAATIQKFKTLWATAGRYASTNPAQAGGDTQTTILWPARANPEQSYAVDYGWQPDQEGHQAYYVQVNPTVLKTLAAGDEIHASIDPSAGRVARFVIASGSKQLPRIGLPASETVAPVATRPPSSGSSRFTTNDTPAPSNTGSASSRTRFNTEPDAAGGDLRGSAYGESPAYGSSSGQLIEAPRNDYRDPPLDRGDDRRQQPLNTPGENVSYNQPPQNTGRFNEPRGSLQPPVDYGPAPAPQPSFVQPVGNQQPQYAPQQPYQPSTTSFSPPLTNNDRLAALQPPPGPAATLPPAIIPPASSPAGTSAANASGGTPTGTMWLMLMFALFLSIGGNAYLAWTAAEFYSRYRTAVDRLRSAART